MKEILNKLIVFKNPNYFEGKKITVWFYILFIMITGVFPSLVYKSQQDQLKNVLILQTIVGAIIGAEILNYFFYFRLKLLKIKVTKEFSRTLWTYNSLIDHIAGIPALLFAVDGKIRPVILLISWALYLINLNNTLTTLYSTEIQIKKRMYLAIFLIIPSCVMGLGLL